MFSPKIKIIDIPYIGYDEELPTVHILHGIHSSDPLSGPGNWAKYFTDAGFNIRIWDYGHVYALTARFMVNPHVVDMLLLEVKEDDILLGHSNGCTILADATDKGLQAGGIILLNPALNVDRRISCDIPWIHIYCNKDDKVVTSGKWWRRVNPVSWFIRHPYGEQGRYGPDFVDKRYKVFRGESPPEDLPMISGHSHINDEWILKKWGPFGAQKVLMEID